MTGRAALRSVAPAIVLLLVLVGCQPAAVAPPASSATDPSTATDLSAASGPSAVTDPLSGLPIVALADLPPEAAATVELIDAGGPFPYDQDGAVFQNREGILPDRASGYYHEYTVETPGSDDRGARRIVTGSEGEMYWTADHYDSFERIER
jgi:ribonuclease T1